MCLDDRHDGLANACVGRLNVEHGADGSDNVADDNRSVGLTLLLIPSKEEEG